MLQTEREETVSERCNAISKFEFPGIFFILDQKIDSYILKVQRRRVGFGLSLHPTRTVDNSVGEFILPWD